MTEPKLRVRDKRTVLIEFPGNVVRAEAGKTILIDVDTPNEKHIEALKVALVQAYPEIYKTPSFKQHGFEFRGIPENNWLALKAANISEASDIPFVRNRIKAIVSDWFEKQSTIATSPENAYTEQKWDDAARLKVSRGPVTLCNSAKTGYYFLEEALAKALKHVYFYDEAESSLAIAKQLVEHMNKQ